MDEQAIYKAFGKAVAERRNALDKTQEVVAADVGLSRASLANIERGNQRVFLHQVLAISSALGLDSAHEIVPERAIPIDPLAKPGVTMSGAKKLSKDQQLLVNNIVTSITNSALRGRRG